MKYPYYRTMQCDERVQIFINLLRANVIQDAIRERAFGFWLDFLHNDETCSLKFNWWSAFTPSYFSYLLLLTVSLPIYIWRVSLVLFMSKWYLPGFFFLLLSLSHCHGVSATFSNLIRTSEIFKPVQQFATGMLRRNKKRSHKNILNNKMSSIDPWGTPNKISFHSM